MAADAVVLGSGYDAILTRLFPLPEPSSGVEEVGTKPIAVAGDVAAAAVVVEAAAAVGVGTVGASGARPGPAITVAKLSGGGGVAVVAAVGVDAVEGDELFVVVAP